MRSLSFTRVSIVNEDVYGISEALALELKLQSGVGDINIDGWSWSSETPTTIVLSSWVAREDIVPVREDDFGNYGQLSTTHHEVLKMKGLTLASTFMVQMTLIREGRNRCSSCCLDFASIFYKKNGDSTLDSCKFVYRQNSMSLVLARQSGTLEKTGWAWPSCGVGFERD